MRRLFPLLLLTPALLAAQVRFEDHFQDHALRIDLHQTGDASTENVTLAGSSARDPGPSVPTD